MFQRILKGIQRNSTRVSGVFQCSIVGFYGTLLNLETLLKTSEPFQNPHETRQKPRKPQQRWIELYQTLKQMNEIFITRLITFLAEAPRSLNLKQPEILKTLRYLPNAPRKRFRGATWNYGAVAKEGRKSD